MSVLTVLALGAVVLVVLSATGVGEWLAWNASFFLGREQAERRALYGLQLKLGLLKSLVRAIARAEGRLLGRRSGRRHTR